jgi:fructuronate reductase
MGAVTGRAFIADCIAQPGIRQYVHRLMSLEVAPHLKRSDWAAYRDALIERFANPHLRHSVHQIATDSSLKIPQRWPGTILSQLSCGASVDHMAFAAATWIRYALGEDEAEQAYALNDPQAPSIVAMAKDQKIAPQPCTDALLSRQDIWGSDLPHQAAWRKRVCDWHAEILQRGLMPALDHLLASGH